MSRVLEGAPADRATDDASPDPERAPGPEAIPGVEATPVAEEAAQVAPAGPGPTPAGPGPTPAGGEARSVETAGGGADGATPSDGARTAEQPASGATETGPSTPGASGSGADAVGGSSGGGGSGGGGSGGGSSGGGAGEGGADVDLNMPEAPDAPSDENEQRLTAAATDMGAAGAEAGQLPAGEATAADARGAVTEPEDETAGRAEVALTQALDDKPSPSAEILELCDRIRQAIRDKRPPDEDSLVKADPEAMAKAAGNTLQSDVKGDAERVQGEYTGMDEAPAGQPAQTPTDYETPDPAVAADGGDATQASPDEVPEEDFSLDADVEDQEAAMEEAGMRTEPAQLVQDGPIGEARTAQGELEEAAAENPAELAARQAEAIASAETDMAALQAEALAALQASRARTVAAGTGRQGQMVGTEEQMRAQAGQRMRQIFTDARSQVTTLLEPLSTNAMAKWDAGVATCSSAFKASLAKVDRLIDERHSGIGGAIVSIWDDVVGLPDEIVAIYDTAEKKFGDDVCALIMEISEEVNGIIAACEAIIADARKQIDAVVDSLPEELQGWAQGEAGALNEELDALQGEVQQTQADFTRDLCDRASNAVQEVREEVHARREAAKGIVGRIADAIQKFLEDPFKFIVDGLLSLAGIDPGAFWALVDKLGDVVQAIADDPIGFCGTLLGAVGDGFKQFFDNILTHLGNGFFEWITGGLSTVGVQIPPDFSLGSIVTLCLQVMGLTWDRIKVILGNHIGAENVELLEKAVEFIGTFMSQGAMGLFEMLKEHFDPSQLVTMVKDAAMNWLVEKVITQAAIKLVSMLNPAGAIVQAVMAVYNAVTWLFDNAAKIFKVVEAITNGAAELIAGNTAALAGKVELALAGMIAPAIDFVAELIGLGDLPGKIAGIIQELQEWVLGVVDKAIGWVVKHVKKLLGKLGLGGEEEQDEEGEEEPNHEEMGQAAADELKTHRPEDDEDYPTFRARLEEEARKIESAYEPKLEDQVHMTITFADAATDEEDGDLDFNVRIAPNDCNVKGSVQTGVQLEPGAIVEPDGKTLVPDEVHAKRMVDVFRTVKDNPSPWVVDQEGTEAREMSFEAHHVPPKGVLAWLGTKASYAEKKLPQGAPQASTMAEIEMSIPASLHTPGMTLPAVSLNAATHRLKKPEYSDPDFRVHWGKKTSEVVLQRLRDKIASPHQKSKFAIIFRNRIREDERPNPALLKEMVDELVRDAREDGREMTSEEAIERLEGEEHLASTQFFKSELNAAVKRQLEAEIPAAVAEGEKSEDEVIVAETERWLESVREVVRGAYHQGLQATLVGLQNSKVDGTVMQRAKAASRLQTYTAEKWKGLKPIQLLGGV